MKHVVVIGGGIAGIETASLLSRAGHWVTIIEKNTQTGGKMNQWAYLFPDFTKTDTIQTYLEKQLTEKNLSILTNTEIHSVEKSKRKFKIQTSTNEKLKVDAIVVATGFDIYDAKRKEEYGYKIYENVLTSADLEERFRMGRPILTSGNKKPSRIAFVHCVGSRDEKSGNHYCSKVCCITGVKQAIELKKQNPDTEISCFYMDLRMYGKHFEELYREAQEKYNIQFIRGRLSEAAENMDKSLLIKAEDTLSGRPLKMNVDMLVLLVGIEAGRGTSQAARCCNIKTEESRFLASIDSHLKTNLSSEEGIFVAGTCTAPMSVNDTLTHARSAAIEVNQYLTQKHS